MEGRQRRDRVQADGRHERPRLLSLTTSGCSSRPFIYEKGTVEIGGDRLTSRVNQGHTCAPPNSWRTTRVNAETWVFHFGKDPRGADVMVPENLGGDAGAHDGRQGR